MIELKKICAGYGGKEVLHEVSAIFESGKITVIVGPNGCGKSTLLKTVVRIHEKTSGEIFIDNKSADAFSSIELARHVAYLPQSKKAPDISVLKLVLHGRFAYLNYPRKYREKDYKLAKNALKWVNMLDKSEELVSTLSGGMQQKVYIAMALAQDADTILMDEPTTYLDVVHQLKVMQMARNLADAGKAVVMVLHDLSQALRIADRVLVLKEGENMMYGMPDEVYESGILQNTFGVSIERVRANSGYHYFYD